MTRDRHTRILDYEIAKLYGPPEYAPDEEPGADDVALFQQAAADMADQEASDG